MERPGIARVSEVAIAREIGALVAAMPGVAALSHGRFAEAATYGPGETVYGVVVSRTAGGITIQVHVVARYSPALVIPQLAQQVRELVRRAIRRLGAEPIQRIDVAIDDLWTEVDAAGP